MLLDQEERVINEENRGCQKRYERVDGGGASHAADAIFAGPSRQAAQGDCRGQVTPHGAAVAGPRPLPLPAPGVGADALAQRSVDVCNRTADAARGSPVGWRAARAAAAAALMEHWERLRARTCARG
jgi:hypothetical protein